MWCHFWKHLIIVDFSFLQLLVVMLRNMKSQQNNLVCVCI